jgi:hypothetical protein
LLRKQILLLDPSLHNFEEGNEIDDLYVSNTHATDQSASVVPQIANGAAQQNNAAGENFSQNAASSHSYGSFDFSAENDGSMRSEADPLQRSPSGSSPTADSRRSVPASSSASGAHSPASTTSA